MSSPPPGTGQQIQLTPDQIMSQMIGRLMAVRNTLPLLPLTLSQRISIDFAKCTHYEKRQKMRDILVKGQPVLDGDGDPKQEIDGDKIAHVIIVDGEETELSEDTNPIVGVSELDMFLPIWNAAEKIAAFEYFAKLQDLAGMIAEPEEETPVQEMTGGAQ